MKAIVVGGGIVGLAVAEALVRRGVKVELLERNAEVGMEASGVAAGILSPLAEAEGPGPFLNLLLSGHRLISEEVERLAHLTGVDLQYRVAGMMAIALTESEEEGLRRKLAWQQAAGWMPEAMEPQQIRREEPAIDGPVRFGIWWPDTSQINALRFVQAYQKAFELEGGRIRTGTAVRRFWVEKDRVLGVETANEKIEAQAVVNCAGPWAGFDSSCPVKIPALPVKGQILLLSSPGEVVRHIVKSAKTYLVQRDSNQLFVGTTVEQAGFDKRVTSEGVRSIRDQVGELASGTSPLRQAAAWAGLRPGTPDLKPILGPTPLKGLWMATGHFRNGILLAPLTGQILADAILGEPPAVDLESFRLDRFGGAV